jgi:hypothetical protein
MTKLIDPDDAEAIRRKFEREAHARADAAVTATVAALAGVTDEDEARHS